MELEDYYSSSELRNNKDPFGPQRQNQNEGKARNRRSRCLLLLTVILGISCLFLIAAIILQHFRASSKQGFLWGPDGLFISDVALNWFDSRQFCKGRGADLVIIKSEEKQRHISSFIKESVWIGLSDTETTGNLKWVDNSQQNRGFWAEGEPNNYIGRKEDCVELNPAKNILHNWNDLLCSDKRKAICEK